MEENKENKRKVQEEEETKNQVVIPYVKGVSERAGRIFRKYGVRTAMKPVKTLRQVLVHPKDKRERDTINECVYEIPCAGCEKKYIGETGRAFGTRLKEHQKDCESIPPERRFTRAEKKEALQTFHKSAVTDHQARYNHIIDWNEAKIIDRESERRARQVREAIWIRRKSKECMNRDDGAYILSHTYDSIIAAPPGGDVRQ